MQIFQTDLKNFVEKNRFNPRSRPNQTENFVNKSSRKSFEEGDQNFKKSACFICGDLTHKAFNCNKRFAQNQNAPCAS